MRRLIPLLPALLLLLAALSLRAAPATLYRNAFDDASALDGWETSPGAEGGSVGVEDGALVLRGAPFSYRGARAALPLATALGRSGPFLPGQLARSHISWTFNLSYENAADGSTNTGFRIYPLAASASPETGDAASYALRGGIYSDNRLVFQRTTVGPSGRNRAAMGTVPAASGLAPAPWHGSVRIDLFLSNSPTDRPGWVVRLRQDETPADPEHMARDGQTTSLFTESLADSATPFTHFVIEAQNGGAVRIDNLVVSTYVQTADDARGPWQIIPWPGNLGSTVTFGDPPVSLPTQASSGRAITWTVSFGPARIVNGMLEFTGAGYVGLNGTVAADSSYLQSYLNTYVQVLPKPITITLSGLAQTYRGAAHLVEASPSPPGVPLRVTYDGETTPPRHVGNYAVVATSVSNDYAGRAEGSLVVTRAPLVVRPAPVLRLIGQDNPTFFNLIYEGLLGSDAPADIDTPPTVRTTATRSSPAGEYPLTLSGGADADYTLQRLPGKLTVLAYAGTYEALLTPPGAPDAPPLGKLTLTTSATKPVFSGTLWLADENIARPFTGSGGELRDDGFIAASATLPAKIPTTAGTYRVALAWNATRLHAVLTRLPSGGEASEAARSEEGTHRYRPSAGAASPWQGAHTALLRAPRREPADLASIPGGPGFATANITASSGALALAGRLPDGTTLSASSTPDDEGRHRVFVRPHGAKRPNALVGELRLLPHPTLADRHHVPAGQQRLYWSKNPSAADKLYPQGFANLALDIDLEPWLPPVTASSTREAITLAQRLGVPGAPASLTVLHPAALDATPASAQLPGEVTLDAEGKALVVGDNPSRWTVNFNSTRGTLSGSFKLTFAPLAPATKPVVRKFAFSGVLRQPGDSSDLEIGAAQLIWTAPDADQAPTTEEMLFLRPAAAAPDPAP